jgi:predicted aspartyl protease
MFDVRVKLASLAAPSRAAEVTLLVDTGATLSWIPRDVLERLGVTAFSRLPFALADGRRLERDITAVLLTIDGRKAPVPVAFGEPGEEAVLGATALEGLGFMVDPVAKKLVPRDLLALMERVMQDQTHLSAMQCYIAYVGITPSALRNLGAGHFVGTAQEFLRGIDLTPLSTIDPSGYPDWLERKTQALMEKFPIKGLWGPARKSMNIFMVMASLNRFLCAAYALDHLEDVLEVPLDNRVATKLLKWAKGKGLSQEEVPQWTSIKKLDRGNSEKFQKVAEQMATELAIPRGRLDVTL